MSRPQPIRHWGSSGVMSAAGVPGRLHALPLGATRYDCTPRLLGPWPKSHTYLRTDIVLSAFEPWRSASENTALALQFGRWTPGAHRFFTLGELAELRWLHVDYASRGRGAELQQRLREQGYRGLAFMGLPQQVPAEQRDELGPRLRRQTAHELEAELRGHLFMLPLTGWKPKRALEVLESCEKELAERRNGGRAADMRKVQTLARGWLLGELAKRKAAYERGESAGSDAVSGCEA